MRETDDTQFLTELQALLIGRKQEMPEDSYTSHLFAKGIAKIAQKVGEEGVETAIAAVQNNRGEIISESADLLFHLLVLLVDRNIAFSEVIAELEKRHNKNGEMDS
jgi:phosphoribosyl-ATP pyrophosphohydrolase/phosphoribosyl-AMP cyclohydrolase